MADGALVVVEAEGDIEGIPSPYQAFSNGRSNNGK